MSSRRTIFQVLVGIVLVFTLCAGDAAAQKRKRRTTRRARPAAPRPVITNPPIAPPEGAQTGEIKIISTAEDGPVTEQEAEKTTTTKPATQSGDEVQKSIKTLSNEVKRLNDRLSRIQEEEQDQREVDRLTQAEQKAEQFRTQLLDVQTKIADLQAKLELVDYALKPENIDKTTQGSGSVRPEEVRETRRRQLENEKGRIQAQLNLLETSKTRLELSVNRADSEVDQLRLKLNQRRERMNNNAAVPENNKPDQPNF